MPFLRAQRTLLAIVAALFVAPHAFARGVYQAPDAFIAEMFSGKPPAPQFLWLTDAVQADVKAILGHPYAGKRVRYWRKSAQTVWVLEEIGKEEPITAGIVVHAGRLEMVRVLVFRESRGDEVRHRFFTDQFRGAGLAPGKGLDRGIDGISGATLSVRALHKLAHLALYLHTQLESAK